MIVLEIPIPTPSRNAFHHKHWRVEHSAKLKWDKLIWAELARVCRNKKGAFVIPVAKGRRNVCIQRHGKRKLDHDNFVGGLKGILDVLKKHQLIVDDNEEWMGLCTHQLSVAKGQKPHTVISIADQWDPKASAK
jgi:hypothetical protein